MTINNTQRREALKIVVSQARQAQKAAIAKLRASIKGRSKAPAKIQRLYEKMKETEAEAERVRMINSKAQRAFHDAVGANRVYGSKNYVIEGGVVYYRTPHFDVIQHNTEPFRYKGRTHKESDPVEQALMLRGLDVATEAVDIIEALQEFIDVEAPAQVWLSDTTDAAKFLDDLTKRIAGIIA